MAGTISDSKPESKIVNIEPVTADKKMTGHHHSADEYKQLQRRISIIVGHVTSIKRMIEDERDCSEILIQISAVQSSLNNLGKVILKNHINECLDTASDSADPVEHQKEIDYLTDAIDKFIR